MAFSKYILKEIKLVVYKASTVNPLYSDMVFAAKYIIIKGVLLYLIFVYKMHLKLKLGNDIISTPAKL